MSLNVYWFGKGLAGVIGVGVLSLILAQALAYGAGEPAAPGGSSMAPAKTGVERHLANIRQLTVGRQNAEAYFSFEGSKLVFQSTNDWRDAKGDMLPTAKTKAERGLGCYQIYVMDLESESIRLVSTGVGATASTTSGTSTIVAISPVWPPASPPWATTTSTPLSTWDLACSARPASAATSMS